MPRLILNPDSESSQAFDLHPGTCEIGRRPDNLICIPDDSVSSLHCRITVDGNNAALTDLDSTNGTFVEEQQVTNATLQHGQRLRFGDVEVLFENDPAQSSQAPSHTNTRMRVKVDVDLSQEIGGHDETVLLQPSPGTEEANQRAAFVADTCCRYHPRSLAQYCCPKCKRFFCDLCVSTRHENHKPVHHCRSCGVKCKPVRSASSPDSREPFARSVGKAFAYPLIGSGWMLIMGGTFLMVLVDVALKFAGFAGFLGLLALLVLSLFGGGYIFSYLKSIVLTSAQGAKEMPDWPDFNDWGSDVILPFFQGLGLLAFCYGPALALLIYAGVTENPIMSLGALGLGLLGLAYFPMAMLSVSMFDGLVGLTPVVVLPSIIRVPVHYLAATAILLAVALAGITLAVLLEWLVPIPILPGVLGYAILFYAVVVEARILGVLYHTNEDALGWFKPRVLQ